MSVIQKSSVLAAAAAGMAAALASGPGLAATPNYSDIDTIVVIYAENRSFDSLFGSYPGANGLSRATAASSTQLDRDGSVLPHLPPVWGGTSAGVTAGAPLAPQILTEAQTGAYLGTFNHPFSLLSLYGSASTIDTKRSAAASSAVSPLLKNSSSFLSRIGTTPPHQSTFKHSYYWRCP